MDLRADNGEKHAAEQLAELLAGRGDEDGLARRADTGDKHAAWWLAELRATRDGVKSKCDHYTNKTQFVGSG